MEMNFFGRKRSIVCTLSIVALLSVALGHTVPDSSMKTTLESLVEFVDKPVKKSDAISDNFVGPFSKPYLVDNCKVDVGSYSFADSRKCGYVRTSGGSSEVILDPNDISKNRGVTLFELDPITCTTLNRQRFDTFGVADDRVRLVEALESASVGTIIIGVTADSAETIYLQFRNKAYWFFDKYNMNLQYMLLGYGSKLDFIIQSGFPHKTKHHNTFRGGDCLEKSFTVKVYRVIDVSFF